MADMRHLTKKYNTYHVVKEIPKNLRPVFDGKARFTASLGTHSLKEAQRRRHDWLAKWEQLLRLAERTPQTGEQRLMADAEMRGREYREASEEQQFEIEDGVWASQRDILLDQARDEAAWLHEDDPDFAEKFFRISKGEQMLSKLADDWLEYVRPTVGASAMLHHEHALRLLRAHFGDDHFPSDLARLEAGKFLADVVMKNLSRATVNKHLWTYNQLWKWLLRRGHVEYNPWTEQSVKVEKDAISRRAFTDKELVKLLSTPIESRIETKLVLPDLMRLALFTGARIEELCSMEREHLTKQDDGWWWEVHGTKTKAAKRMCPLHACLNSIIERRLADDRHDPDGDRFLFKRLKFGGPGGSVRSAAVSKAFTRHRKSAGVADKDTTFHSFRHTLSTVLRGADVPIPTIQLIIGHKSEGVIFTYAKGDLVDTRAAIDKTAFSDEVSQAVTKHGSALNRTDT